MKHLSIEGMDGVGKSTVCQLLTKKLDFEFVEKPLHLLFDEDVTDFTNYIRIRDIVNKNKNRDFTSLFYGLGSLYLYELYKDKNIITDRHLASNYAWSGVSSNEDIYELLIEKIGKPQLTVILYASSEVISKRLKKRNPSDSDIIKVNKSEKIYNKMKFFCEKYEFKYILLDTENLCPNDIVEKIVKEF